MFFRSILEVHVTASSAPKAGAEVKAFAILDGKAVTIQEFQAIAELPSRDVLISKLLFLMQYPVSGLAIALDQIRQQKEGAA